MDIKEYIEKNNDYQIIKIKVIPNSDSIKFVWIMDDWTFKIRLKSIPEKGKANDELINFFSKELDITKDKIILSSGKTSRQKSLKILY